MRGFFHIMIIAIDGPAGSGKSTVAKRVAKRLAFTYLDTGAMYRAVTWRALSCGIALDDTAGLVRIAKMDPITFTRARESWQPDPITIAGIDATSFIRTPQVDASVSAVSAIPSVREALVEQQRAIARGCDIVMEGRDIGTVVFPHAELKVFLTASPEERARRRAGQNTRRHSGETDPKIILSQIVERDRLDSARATAPLVAACDALILDSSKLEARQVAAVICRAAIERGAIDPRTSQEPHPATHLPSGGHHQDLPYGRPRRTRHRDGQSPDTGPSEDSHEA
jgi:cytidylate kinase